MDVFINATGKFLPGMPVSNDEMEEYLGLIDGEKSKFREVILRKNRIQHRHYALDKAGRHLFTNAQLAANAIKDAIAHSELNLSDIEFLATSTTQGDLLVPGFASSVHAEVGIPPIEIASFQSVCASSMMAMRGAFLQIKSGEKRNALACGSEFSSRWFRPGFYEPATNVQNGTYPNISTEFLRWTLSDGAGAAVLENRPNDSKLSFKIEWIDICSYADRFPQCMYAGSSDNTRDRRPWSHFQSPISAIEHGAVMLKQDFELLYKMFSVWVSHYLSLIEKKAIIVEKIDHFLAHYSAHSLRERMIKLLKSCGGMIQEEKWFTNLYSKGNTGSAAIYIMLEELMNERVPKRGEKILCFVPESGQCMIAFMLLTVA